MDALQPFAKKNNVVENMKRAVSNAQKAVEEASGQIFQATTEGELSTPFGCDCKGMRAFQTLCQPNI